MYGGRGAFFGGKTRGGGGILLVVGFRSEICWRASLEFWIVGLFGFERIGAAKVVAGFAGNGKSRGRCSHPRLVKD